MDMGAGYRKMEMMCRFYQVRMVNEPDMSGIKGVCVHELMADF